MSSPVLTTRRLTLRLPEDRDFDAFAAFVALDRARWVGGPGTREDARKGFDELREAGAPTAVPKLHCVQAEAVRPIEAALTSRRWRPASGSPSRRHTSGRER